ncbi:MAG: hypothetical protein LM550_15140 [Candidatus Contendobacter sp.]|nr:hypothetical protein [Candidatus Contendobacter sp.]
MELTGLAVRVPRQQDFDQMGVERLELLSTLKFAIPKPGEPPVIKVTSQEPIREPNFNLLLEVVWPRGRLFRAFPVHLDPELYVNRRQPPPPPAPVLPPPPVVATAPAAAVVPTLPPAPPVNFDGAALYLVKPGETLRAVANRVRPSTAISLPQMMAILVAGNPEAFANGNPNTLRAGATLRVPTPQALGLPGAAPTPLDLAAAAVPSPDLAAAPVESGSTLSPAPPTPPVPSPAPITDSIPPPSATTSVTAPPPLPVTPAPLPTPTEPAREIIPQASVPQPEPSPPPVTAAQPPEPVSSPVAAPPPPEPVKPAPAVKPPAPVIETEASWMDNPVVWIAIVLIVVAVAAMLLLPLLRRTARPKPAVSDGVEGSVGADDSSTQIQDSQPRTRRTQPIAELAAASAVAAAAPAPAAPMPRPAAELAPKPAAAPPKPRPIDDLLKDIDFGLGTEQLSNLAGAAGAKSPTPASAGMAPPPRLPDAEPPTSPINPVSKPETHPAPQPAKPEVRTPPSPAVSPQAIDLPSDLRLDGMDFDFGDFGNTARSQPEELPPLELKPAAPRATSVDLSPLTLDVFEPLTEPPSIGAARAAVSAAPVPETPTAPPASQKFEFSDVSQDYQATGEDSFRLDEELMGIGGKSLDLGRMDLETSTGGGASGADYVETKLDLATAYLDMGDQVGARSLLEDVLREGDHQQKTRAGELLKKLG